MAGSVLAAGHRGMPGVLIWNDPCHKKLGISCNSQTY